MAKVDPRLRLLIDEMSGRSGTEFAAAGDVPLGGRIAWDARADGATIEVLVEGVAEADLDELGPALPGATVGAAGSVRRVRLPVTELPALAGHDAVARVEASRPLFPELNWSRTECGAETLHTATPGVTGSGVVVAVLDSGIDYTHPCFRRPDGGTRIVALWDQGADPAAGSTVPFGREYQRADIDRALAAPDPLAVVPHEDRSGHGTHVAGIAAGDERDRGLFTGIAPGADLIVVALGEDGASLGTSTRVVAGLDYVRQRAAGRPVVVNLSQGTNIGGHGGESLLERRIDELSRQPGFVVVKSAGNERQWGVHAGGSLSPGGDRFLEFDVAAGNRFDDVVEVWFSGHDDIEVGVTPPAGAPSSRVRPGSSLSFETGTGNQVRIDVDEDADDTGDRRASVIVRRGAAEQIQPGRWNVVLRAGTVRNGRFDAWIERAPRDAAGAPEQSRFAPGERDPSRTITVPGSARRVVTVGSYVTKSQVPAAIGQLSEFSSLGPTRDGRDKPELTAPGEFVTSARAGWRDGGDSHRSLMGTSMAAPHVTGATALVLQAVPLLTAEQVSQVLRRSLRPGAKLDAVRAVELARTAVFPVIVSLQADAGRLTVRTDIATTAVLTADGRSLAAGSATTHTFDLPAGAVARGSVAVTAAGWTTSADVSVRTGDDFGGIAGLNPVITERLGRKGIVTLSGLAGSTPERLASVTGVPVETVRAEDWPGQARKLTLGGGRTFAVVAVPGDDESLAYEVVDGRTHERATGLDGAGLLSFLEEHA
ncbi:S8 family serine peptidase [Paractinoplanes lichenicola]|uniref:S8 family serine peptidase n=1 Tax=Paractinoplanes lichenicola TaxID=2802976 RepID=A0ABS1VNQ4_9ACTN|nr:S8 family serine peptidase [Actinoplanes lichenicola]MBL7256263.1 S8 family serine peptidase [Actinoplanes lichenicola]